MKVPLSLLSLFLLLNTYLPAQEIASWWTDKPVTIDGNPAEWPALFRYYDGTTKLQFSVCNDTSNIYVCIKVTDEHAQLRLFRSGLNVWIDPKGKKKETTGINFPIKVERKAGDAAEAGPARDPYQKPDMRRLRERVLISQNMIKITGFTGIGDQLLPLDNPQGVTVGYGWDSLDIFCVEYKFPIQRTLQHSLTPADTTKPLQLGLIVGALDIPKTTNPDADQNTGWNDQNMRGSNNLNNNLNNGLGGMNNQGMGSMNQPIMDDSNYTPPSAQELKVWSKLKLAWKAL